MSKSFIFNDENVYNTYGFRTANSGIALSRFKENPVMLDGHWADTQNVIGRWEDVALSDAHLTGRPVFDLEDERAKKISGKVDRNFLKACSMGLLFNPEHMQREPNGKWLLTQCELLEVSIVAIPSNASAIRLYVEKDGDYQVLSEDEIKLCLSGIHVDTNFSKQENTMKKIILSVASLVALGLDKSITNPSEGVDENVLNNAIGDLKSKLDNSEQQLSAANLALKSLKDAALEQKKLAAEKIVDDAINAGKIDATAKADWLKLATDNEALATSTLAALPAKTNLSGQVNNPAPGTTGEVKTMEDFQKLSLSAQKSFKAEKPEAYAELVAGM